MTVAVAGAEPLESTPDSEIQIEHAHEVEVYLHLWVLLSASRMRTRRGTIDTGHKALCPVSAPATHAIVYQYFVCLIEIGHEYVISRAVTRRIKDETASGTVSTLHQRAALTTAPATQDFHTAISTEVCGGMCLSRGGYLLGGVSWTRRIRLWLSRGVFGIVGDVGCVEGVD